MYVTHMVDSNLVLATVLFLRII